MSKKTSSVKIVLVGPSNAGKTSIAKRFTTDTFDEHQDMTVGSAFFSKQVTSAAHGAQARVEVWDTAGQEKYRSMAPMYFRNAAGALLVFDQTDPSSFDDVERIWLPELLPNMKNSTQFIIMCANKADIATDEGAHGAFMERVKSQCAARGIALYATSAKSGKNVTEVFAELVDLVIDARNKEAEVFAREKSRTSTTTPATPAPIQPGKTEKSQSFADKLRSKKWC